MGKDLDDDVMFHQDDEEYERGKAFDRVWYIEYEDGSRFEVIAKQKKDAFWLGWENNKGSSIKKIERGGTCCKILR